MSCAKEQRPRRVFETVLRRCIREGLVGGEGFAVDASLIKADANRQNGIEGEKGLPSEATGRPIEEYLAVLDDAAFGAATEVTPKFVSPSDPAARWTGAHGGQAFFAYSTNYLVDVENAIIVDIEATTAIRQAEVVAAKRIIERSIERFGLYPSRLLAIAPMALPRCSAGLSTSTGLSRTSPCSTSRLEWMAPLAGGLHLRPSGRCLLLPWWQATDHDRHAGERPRNHPLSCEQA
jgi:hypothetical protein